MTTTDFSSATRRGSEATGCPAPRGNRVPAQAALGSTATAEGFEGLAAPAGPAALATAAASAASDEPGLERRARASLSLAARADRVTLARSFIEEVLGGRHPCAETAVLLASELVTNSIRHSGSRLLGETITITVIVVDNVVRIEVTDCSGSSVPQVRAGGKMAEGGRGLQLVEALAANWGYWRDDGRTTTWFACTPLTCFRCDRRVERTGRTGRTGRVERVERTGRVERLGRAERAGRAGRSGRGERGAR